jgi:hypothetical protein
MGIQLKGSIEIGDDQADAMMCIDDDRVSEAMLHWWIKGKPSNAALVALDRQIDGRMALSPKALYGVGDLGEVYPRVLPPEEWKKVACYSALLSERKDGLEGKWNDGSGSEGEIHLESFPTIGVVADQCVDWEQFKNWTIDVRKNHGIVSFRGHGSNQFRLRTSLHRLGRRIIERYIQEILLPFRLHAESVLNQHININDRDDYAMLVGLAQHHGLPTPLLDFTASPYIAAFFAFSDAVDSARNGVSNVRVYGLSKVFLERHMSAVVALPYYAPYISPLTVSGRNNPRVYAQQGQFLLTNINSFEENIVFLEQKACEKYIVAADIPVKFAKDAINDLNFMGLTAASLFPGLDGVCRMMKHQMLFG